MLFLPLFQTGCVCCSCSFCAWVHGHELISHWLRWVSVPVQQGSLGRLKAQEEKHKRAVGRMSHGSEASSSYWCTSEASHMQCSFLWWCHVVPCGNLEVIWFYSWLQVKCSWIFSESCMRHLTLGRAGCWQLQPKVHRRCSSFTVLFPSIKGSVYMKYKELHLR